MRKMVRYSDLNLNRPLLKNFFFSDIYLCPESHKYAYLEGKRCCSQYTSSGGYTEFMEQKATRCIGQSVECPTFNEGHRCEDCT